MLTRKMLESVGAHDRDTFKILVEKYLTEKVKEEVSGIDDDLYMGDDEEAGIAVGDEIEDEDGIYVVVSVDGDVVTAENEDGVEKEFSLSELVDDELPEVDIDIDDEDFEDDDDAETVQESVNGVSLSEASNCFHSEKFMEIKEQISNVKSEEDIDKITNILSEQKMASREREELIDMLHEAAVATPSNSEKNFVKGLISKIQSAKTNQQILRVKEEIEDGIVGGLINTRKSYDQIESEWIKRAIDIFGVDEDLVTDILKKMRTFTYESQFTGLDSKIFRDKKLDDKTEKKLLIALVEMRFTFVIMRLGGAK